MSEEKFEHWAIVEVFGHQSFAGKVSEQQIGGSSFVRVDVPAVGEREGFTKLFGPGCDHCYAENRNQRFAGGENWGPGAPRKRHSAATWKKPLKWNADAGRGLFVECSVCGKREFRKWDNTLPPGGLSCCSNPECDALPESDSNAVRPRVFSQSLADWLDNEAPIEWLVDLLDLIRLTPNLDWLLLSKRIGNWRKQLEEAELRAIETGQSELADWVFRWHDGNPPANVWIGATIVNQEEADRDIPKLLKVPALIRFLSMEPLLGAVLLREAWVYEFFCPQCGGIGHGDTIIEGDRRVCRGDELRGHCGREVESQEDHRIDWVIAGGESGHNARPMHPDWVRSLRDQCEAAGTKFLFKQWGQWKPVCAQYPANEVEHDEAETASLCGDICMDDGGDIWPESHQPSTAGRPWLFDRVGKKQAGRILDGRTHDEFPEPSYSPSKQRSTDD